MGNDEVTPIVCVDVFQTLIIVMIYSHEHKKPIFEAIP